MKRDEQEAGMLEGDDVFTAAAAAVRTDAADESAWDQLEELAAESQRPDEVAALYREVLSQRLNGQTASVLAQRAVQFHEEWFREDSPSLVEVLERVLQVDPTASEWAFQRLTVVFTVAERWDDLLALYDREIASAHDEHRRASLLEEAAQTAKDFASAPDRAASYLQQLLPLRRGDKQLVSNLERLLERQERWADLVELWRDQLPKAAAKRHAARLRIASHLYEKLARAEAATVELRALLDEGGDPAPALEMLERIARDASVDADARREALGLLRERYEAEDRTTAVIATLDTALELANHAERIALHRDAAARLRAAGVYDEALEHFGAVIALDADEASLAEAREVAELANAPRRLVDLLVASADAAPLADRAPIRLEAAERLVALGEAAAAIPQLELLTPESGVAPGLAITAARLLVEQLGAAGREPEQLAAFERLAGIEDTPSRQRDALGRGAALAARLGDADRALALYERCLQNDPKDAAALGEMIALLEGEARWADLVRALRRREASTSSAWQKRADLVRIARLQSEQLGQLADAIATWTEVGASYGEDAEVADALTALFETTERYEEMAAVLERTATREDAHLADVRARQGDVFARYLSDASRALWSFRRALETRPDHEAAREGLAALCEDETVGDAAVEALAASFEQTGEWEPRLALLERRLASRDARAQVALLREAAQVQEQKAQAPAAALGSIARAFAMAPDDLGLEAELLRLGELAEAPEAVVEAIAAAASAAEGARQAALRAAEAERRSGLGDAAGAFAAICAALRAAPLSEELAAKVMVLGEATEAWAEAAEVLAAVADVPFAPPSHVIQLAAAQRHLEPAVLLPTLGRLADLAQSDLDALHEAARIALELGGAEPVLERLFERAAGLWRRGAAAAGTVAPDVAARWAAERLVELHDAAGRAKAVVPLLVEVARLAMDPADAATWRKEAARRAAELGDRATAIELFRDVVQARDDADALRALGDLLEAEGRRAELLGLRARELALTTDVERRVTLRLGLAALVTEIEERGGRMEALRANLEERPGHEESLEALERILVVRRAHEELTSLLESQAERLEGERAAQLWRRAAALAESELRDPSRAIAAFRKVVELAPEDAESLDALARIHRERGESAAAARWLERRLAIAGEAERPDLAGDLAAQLIAAGRTERAAEVLQEALEQAPARQDLRDLLVEQLRALDAPEALARALAESARHASADQALVLVREAARLYGEVLGRPADAIPVLRQGTELAPDDRSIKLQLAEGLRASGELDEARTLLEQVIEAFGRRRSTERAQVHYQLGTALRTKGDVEGALEQFELATKMAMAEPRMLDALGRLAREAGQLDRAEKAYRALLMTVRRRDPSSEIDVGSGEVLFELHAIAGARGDEEQAGELLESALEAAAQNDTEALRFRDALVERGEVELALRGLERRVRAADEASSKAQMLAAMADVLEGDGRGAEAYERRVSALGHDARSVELQKATVQGARALGKVSELAARFRAILEEHKRDEDAALQASLYVRLGEIAELDEGDLDAATSAYSRAESLAESPVEAWLALARVGAARDDRGLQKRVLQQLVDREGLGSARRTEVLHQLADVLLRDAGRDTDALDRAVEIARRAFDAHPQHATLAEALDLAVARQPDHDAAMQLYSDVALDAGDERLALRFLERRAQRSDATLAQIRDAADKALALDERERAEVLLGRAIEVATSSEEGIVAARGPMRQLAELRRLAGDASGAIAWMQRAVETAIDEDERRAMERELAAVAAADGGDLEVASDTFRRLLEIDPTDATLWRPLLEVEARRGDEGGLSDLVAMLIDALLEPSLRNEARLAKARFLMALPEREFDAVDLLKDALGEEPGNTEAAALLGRLYEKSGYDEDLVELLLQQLDIARDNQDLPQITALSHRLGQLLEKVRREDAIDVYRRALDWVPEERTIIEAYLGLLGPEDDPRERAEVRERLLAVERGDAASKLAREVHEEWAALEDADGMLRALSLGYQGNPEDAELREAVESQLRGREDWADLSDFLVREATRLFESEPEVALGKVAEAATLRRDVLSDAPGAIVILRRAYEGTHSPALLGELVATLEANGQIAEAADVVGSAIAACEGEDETWAQLLAVRARLLLASGETQRAVDDLEAAHRVAPSAVAQLLADALGQRAEELALDEQREVVMRRIEVLETARLAEGARAVLAGWCVKSPNDVEALVRLRAIDLRTENWMGVVDTSNALLGLLDPAGQVQAVMLLTDAAEALGDPTLARPGLEAVFSAQPTEPSVIERLRSLYEATGAARELAGLLAHEAASADPERAFELYRRAGRVLIEQVGDADGALPLLQRAVDSKPDDHHTIILLADAYIGGGHYPEAGQLLETAIQNHPRRRGTELAELQQRMSRLARVAGDRNLEMQWLNAALESDKNHVEIASELAYLSYELGEHDVALNALRAVTLSKTDGPMSKGMAFLLQAKIAHMRGEGRRALLWARKAKQEEPDLQDVTDFLAELGDG
ncbi:MAG: tetratricopeptide repeat protein [Myxococcales bacterium]|nr:tetratricopeptide repeat protein [Myxococcales bacterium]